MTAIPVRHMTRMLIYFSDGSELDVDMGKIRNVEVIATKQTNQATIMHIEIELPKATWKENSNLDLLLYGHLLAIGKLPDAPK